VTTQRLQLGRTLWTVLVTFYFFVFFHNFFADAAGDARLLPLVFSYVLVLWLAVEYYLGSPFFQSGVVEPAPFWRGVFAFFVYPYLGYLAADALWWRWTTVPVPMIVTWIPGMVLFGAGVLSGWRASLPSGRSSGGIRPGAAASPNGSSRRCRSRTAAGTPATSRPCSSLSVPRSPSVHGAAWCLPECSVCRCCWSRSDTRIVNSPGS